MSTPRSALITLLVLTSALLACGEQPESQTRTSKEWTLPVATVNEALLADEYTAIGSVIAERRIDISSKIIGYIKTLTVREGDLVKRGQILIDLDDAAIANTILQAKSGVETASAQLKDLASDVKRFEQLFKEGSISEVKLRKTRLQHSTVQEALASAQAALSIAHAQRQYSRIESPVDGIVAARHKQAGDLAAPGVPLLTVESREQLLFETHVAESQLSHIEVGDPVRLAIDNVSSNLTGTVAYIVQAGDPVSRTYKIKIRLPASGELHSGMFGRAHFRVGEGKNLVIPRSALIEKGGLKGVYVIDNNSRVHFRWVRTKREWPQRVEIAAGLEAGEKIVARAATSLSEDDVIKAEVASK
ncbi:MAG: efflux RND transporter periplasmic adaptor subunit [Gammaproteobacteria bacterium]|nr:efflux RND transporter periplasmic adaptor subunit [Gammaproteobacteria bacterium]MBQ0840555.1 efflux RND transporter periplasmic adaptor subunit [Gammaproteobacteria bacterium]